MFFKNAKKVEELPDVSFFTTVDYSELFKYPKTKTEEDVKSESARKKPIVTENKVKNIVAKMEKTEETTKRSEPVKEETTRTKTKTEEATTETKVEEIKVEPTTTAEEPVSEVKTEKSSAEAKAEEAANEPDSTKEESEIPDEEKTVEFTVKTCEGEPEELIKSITFDAAIDENGQIVSDSIEEKNPNEPSAEQPVYDQSNPYLAAKQKDHEEVNKAMESAARLAYVDNSIMLASYPPLKQIERTVREMNLDCIFIQRPDKLIAVGILANEQPVPTASFMVDLDGIVIGKDLKWFNTFIDQKTNPSVLENYFAIRIYNLELLKKHISGTATIDEYKKAAIYSKKYLAVKDIVDLNTLPSNLNNEHVNKIVDRLYKAIEAGVFSNYKNSEKFKIDSYTSPISYTLKSGNASIIVRRDTMVEEIANS